MNCEISTPNGTENIENAYGHVFETPAEFAKYVRENWDFVTDEDAEFLAENGSVSVHNDNEDSEHEQGEYVFSFECEDTTRIKVVTADAAMRCALSDGDLTLDTDTAQLTAQKVDTATDDGAFEFMYGDDADINDETLETVTVWQCDDQYDTIYVRTETEAREWMIARAAELEYQH
jgi:hypothetical protein